MTRFEEVPTGVNRAALKSLREDQGQAVSDNKSHQRKAGISKLFVDAEQSQV